MYLIEIWMGNGLFIPLFLTSFYPFLTLSLQHERNINYIARHKVVVGAGLWHDFCVYLIEIWMDLNELFDLFSGSFIPLFDLIHTPFWPFSPNEIANNINIARHKVVVGAGLWHDLMDFQSKWTKNDVFRPILINFIDFDKNPPDFLKIHNFSKKTRKFVTIMPPKFLHFFDSQGVPREKLRNWWFLPFLTFFDLFLGHFDLFLLIFIENQDPSLLEVILWPDKTSNDLFFIDFCSFLIEIHIDLSGKWQKLMIFCKKRSLFFSNISENPCKIWRSFFRAKKVRSNLYSIYIYI